MSNVDLPVAAGAEVGLPGLSTQELEMVKKLFGSPLDFPTAFKNWLVSYIEANPPSVVISQVQGFDRYLFTRDTAFPTNPAEGALFSLIVDATNGIVWNFRYNSQSASSYKWEFTGGPAVIVNVDTDEATSSTTYADLTTAGPSFTLPSAGDYVIGHGFEVGATQNTCDTYMSFDIGGTGAADADACYSNANKGAAATRFARKTGLSAVALVSKYRQSSALSASIRHRWLYVQPIRVAG